MVGPATDKKTAALVVPLLKDELAIVIPTTTWISGRSGGHSLSHTILSLFKMVIQLKTIMVPDGFQ